jgi:hypothetical protein
MYVQLGWSSFLSRWESVTFWPSVFASAARRSAVALLTPYPVLAVVTTADLKPSLAAVRPPRTVRPAWSTRWASAVFSGLWTVYKFSTSKQKIQYSDELL